MIALLVRQHRAIGILFVTVFLLGYLALGKLGREELPEFGGNGLNVTALLPGASPEEMDFKVARLLQNEIKDISGVDEVSSSSREGVLHLSVSLKEDEPDHDGLRREIAQVLSQVPDLPVDLEGPYVSRQLERIFPVITLLFRGGDDVARHIAWLEIEQSLNSISEIDAVEVLGDRERRIEIRVDPLRMQNAGLRIDTVGSALASTLTNEGAGQLESLMDLTRIRTSVQPTTTAEIAALPLQTRWGIVPVGQIASVADTLEPEKIRVLHKGDRVWYVNLYRRNGSNIGELSRKVLNVIEQSNAQYRDAAQPFSLKLLYDRSTIVTDNLDQLAVSIGQGMALVLLILCLFLGLKKAFYAAIGIPFSFFAVFIAMDILGLSINTLTLFGLVLVCGMIVDDAIVVIENIHRKQQEGATGIAAITTGLIEVAPPVIAATGTTVAAFLPLLLMTGGMGQYISQIPQVAILALIASLVECLFILPVHLYQKHMPVSSNTRIDQLTTTVAAKFGDLSAGLVRYPYVSLCGFFVLLLLTAGIAYVRMDFQLFAATQTRVIKFHLEFPKDTDINSMQRLLDHGVRQLDGFDDQIVDTVSIIGWTNYNYRTRSRAQLATLEFILPEAAIANDNTDVLADEIGNRLQKLPGLIRLQMSLVTNSPPVGVPVQIYLYGNNADDLKVSSREVRRILGDIPSLEHISDPMEDGIPEQIFEVNNEEAKYYGLSASDIGRLLHGAMTGYKVGKIDLESEIVDLYVKSAVGNHIHMTHLTSTEGRVLPLSQLGRFTEQTAPDSVYRHNGDRYVTITAEINEEIMSNFKTHREIEKRLGNGVLQPGVTFEQQGEYSDTRKSLSSMIQSAVIAIGLCYLILATLFRSLLQPVIVLMVIPLAYMGVVWGMTLTGQPLTLMGFIGVVGLIGIVVNDALVWVSFYNRNRERGESSREAAIGAVKLRFRPIWLTTLTTVAGLLPASMSDSAGIASAMANTMVYGLLSASFLLLLFLPVCVVALDDMTDRIQTRLDDIIPDRRLTN